MANIGDTTHHVGSFSPSNALGVTCNWIITDATSGANAINPTNYTLGGGQTLNSSTIDVTWHTVPSNGSGGNYRLYYSCSQNNGSCVAGPISPSTVVPVFTGSGGCVLLTGVNIN